MDTVLKTLQPGDEVISTNDLYGGSYRLFTTVFAHYGITFHFVDLSDLDSLKAALNEDTRLVWVETPTNPHDANHGHRGGGPSRERNGGPRGGGQPRSPRPCSKTRLTSGQIW